MYKKLFLVLILATSSSMALQPEQNPLKPDFNTMTAPSQNTTQENALAEVRTQYKALRDARKAGLAEEIFTARKQDLHAAAAILDVKLARKINELQ